MNDIEKKYFRFLKECGVYQRGLSLHKKSMRKKNLTLHELFAVNSPISWIQDATIFCNWASSPERDIFWWVVSLLWQSECIVKGYSYFSNGKISTAIDVRRNIDQYVNYYDSSIGLREESVVDRNRIGELKNKLLEYRKELTLITNEKENIIFD